VGKKINTEYLFLLFTLVVTITGVVVLFSAFLDHDDKIYDSASEIMGVKIQQTVYGDSAQKASRAAEKQINLLFSQVSWRNDDSQVKKINDESENEWISTSPGILSILIKSLNVAQDSEGAFDPTILPLSVVWHFYLEKKSTPSIEEINEGLKYVNYKYLKVNKEVLKARLFNEKSRLDLDSVTDGAACSVAIKQYQENGAPAGIIRVGNSVGVYGNKKDNGPFRVNILHPFKRSEGVNFGFLEVKNTCVSTVGFGENSFYQDGKFFHEIINPLTGFPVDNDLVSVTVVHYDGVIASALARACFVLGKDKGILLLDKYEAGGVFIDGQKNVFTTENTKETLDIVNIGGPDGFNVKH
jgi:thiamine biosynthesis lipoprotein